MKRFALALLASTILADAASADTVDTGWVASVGGVTANPSGCVLTRPADTNAYSANDLIASSTTAGSVAVPSCAVARKAGLGGVIPRFRLTTNVTAGWDASVLRIRFWTAAPTYTNGDNGAYAVATGAAGYLGQCDLTLSQFGDGASGACAPSVGNFISFKLAAGQVIYWDLQETSGALTPIAGQTFTLIPEELQD